MQRALLLVLLSLFASPAPALDYRNCGESRTLAQPPKRILALNQHAADLLLALDITPAAVSYIDDDAGSLVENRYRGVPLLSRRYPSQEVFYAGRFDFVVGGFASALREGDGIGPRADLTRRGIASYLLENACTPQPASGFAAIEDDLRNLGHLLGRDARAEQLIAAQRQDLGQARQLATHRQPVSVFYLDSETRGLESSGGKGFISELIAAAGGRNILADLDLHGVSVDAETLLLKDPDVIILADAVWSRAAAKRTYLRRHPALSHLRAVRENRMIDLPFTHLVAGEHSARTTLELARQLRAMSD